MVLMLLVTFGMKAPAGSGGEASHALTLPDRHA
jgi:hypothetical protein